MYISTISLIGSLLPVEIQTWGFLRRGVGWGTFRRFCRSL